MYMFFLNPATLPAEILGGALFFILFQWHPYLAVDSCGEGALELSANIRFSIPLAYQACCVTVF